MRTQSRHRHRQSICCLTGVRHTRTGLRLRQACHGQPGLRPTLLRAVCATACQRNRSRTPSTWLSRDPMAKNIAVRALAALTHKHTLRGLWPHRFNAKKNSQCFGGLDCLETQIFDALWSNHLTLFLGRLTLRFDQRNHPRARRVDNEDIC